MVRGGRLVALVLGCGMLNGCIAAIAPIVAAGAVGGKQVLGRKDTRPDAPPPAPVPSPAPPPRVVATPAPRPAPVTTAAQPPVTAPVEATPTPPTPMLPTPTLPTHSWRAMVTYVAEILQAKTRPVDSAVLAPAATIAAPRFLPCGAKPFAVIVDAEGTVLPRLDAAPGTTVRTDEAASAFSDLRFGRVTVIFTSGSPLAGIAATEAALESARLGPAMQGRELLSVADGAAGASKAALRVAAADQYCVLALVGDDPEDFSDLRAAADGSAATRWGAGWFRVPAQAAP